MPSRSTLFVRAVVTMLGFVSALSAAESSAGNRLWFDTPGEAWYQESLPIGNGYMAAMIRGQVGLERIPLNEETIWSGGPGESPTYAGGNRPNAHKVLQTMRDLLRDGKNAEAAKVMRAQFFGTIGARPKRALPIALNRPVVRNPPDGKIQFPGFGNNQTAVDLMVEVHAQGPVASYRRALDLDRSVATVAYRAGPTQHRRTAFASYPDRLMVFRFENDHSAGANYSVWLETFHRIEQVSFADGIYTFDAVLENNGVKFQALARIDAPGATAVAFRNQRLEITGAKRVDVIVTIASGYVNRYPSYTGRDYSKLNRDTLGAATSKGFDRLLADHTTDYQALFNRVALSLGTSGDDSLPTPARLARHAQGAPDARLESLYFQFGRYLLISSSRPGTLPAHLQGKWNVEMDPQWASDYHTNINLQMNYWPAEVANLPETHQPLFDYIASLREPGRRSAKDFFNARGWIVNTMNNIYGYTAVNWGDWGYFPGGAAWLCRHLWEHYAFTQDPAFLRDTGYPVMKEAALFWLDYLVEVDGRLVSSPSFSPEHGGISIGASMDQQIAWDLFTNLLAAAHELGDEDETVRAVRVAREKLLGPKIGRLGQLQEWRDDLDDPKNQHRHISHLFALYPGRQISAVTTPALANAARQTLEFRGDGGTGWSIAWKVNFWARLLDGERAYRCLQSLLLPCANHNHEGMKLPGGTYSNLLCAHPPFQIDGNFGGTAGIAEMLLQSHADRIHVLPALPAVWKTGSLTGFKARGAFEIGLTWQESRVTKISIKSLAGNPCRMLLPNPVTGEGFTSAKVDAGWLVEFATVAGRTYFLENRSAP